MNKENLNRRKMFDEDNDNFNNFLVQHLIQKDDKNKQKGDKNKSISHTCFGQPWGSYNISDVDYDTFINLYKKVVGRRDLHVIERQKEVGPLLIDLDFRQEKKHRDRKYLDKHIEIVTKYCIDSIRRYLLTPKDEIEAFVFEKEEPTYDEKQNNYKDGF